MKAYQRKSTKSKPAQEIMFSYYFSVCNTYTVCGIILPKTYQVDLNLDKPIKPKAFSVDSDVPSPQTPGNKSKSPGSFGYYNKKEKG